MIIVKSIVEKKIGAFEVLVGLGAAELIFGSGLGLRILVIGILAAIFFVASRKFGGEFSLSDLFK